MLRRSWVELDLDALANNYDIYKKQIPPSQEIMAVIKADAYGHGEKQVACKLQTLGCNHFAVSNIDEAILLREANITGQILVLGYTPISCANELIKYDITQALLSEEYAEHFKRKGIKAQFAIDTGMNRIGLNADNPLECEKIIRKYEEYFHLTGLFTHLCVADDENETDFTKEQIAKFDTVVNSVKDLQLPYIHCMNSAGGLWCPSYGNLVRLGIVLYGLKPSYTNVLPDGIKPVLKWKSVIAMIKTVHPGETIGYGRTFKVKDTMTIATVPTGYADGYSRMLSNKGIVIIKGNPVPILGRICMDQLMVDVTGMDVAFEDEVTLLGDGYDADDMAKDIGTIGYEVICGISKRVPKVYI